LVPSVVISNNLIYNSGTGGILFSGDAGGIDEIGAAVPFGRIINNTIVGVGGNLSVFPGFVLDTGIQVEENASPTILNNIVSNFNQGISVDALSISTVVGGSLYHANITSNNIAVEDFPLTIADTDPLFVDFAAENFYLSANSEAIDSSIGSLLDRADLVRVKNPHNIAESPIIAPSTDLTGQLRVDDPSVEPPSGFGENVFIDRGAIDRTDFTGPTLNLVAPRDNDAAMIDSNPAPTVLELPADLALSNFRIELLDGVEPADPQDGTGVDDSTVTNEAVEITRDGVLLEEGVDYTFSYNSTSDTIVLTPLSGIWEPDHIYVITLNNTDRFEIVAPSGDIPIDYDPLTDSFNRDGEQFTITDASGTVETFEWESGYTLQVPQTLQLILPAEGGNVGGIQDTNTFTISDGTNFLIFEFDSNQSLNNSNHVRVPYLGSSTLDEIATSIIDVLATTPFDLSPVNLGDGVIHLGAGNTVTVNTFGTPRLGTSQTINPDTFLPQDGIVDGDIFTIDDGTKVETFEFDSDGIFVDANNDTLPDFNVITFNQSQTNADIAGNVATSINGANVNMTAQAFSDGRVHLGGTIAHLISVAGSNGHLLLEGAPGATPDFGIRIPTVAGAPDGVLDGMQFTLENTASNTSFIFEFDRVDDPNQVGSASPNAIPITANSSTDDIANAIVAAISNVDLNLEPTNDGNGIINLGGTVDHVLTIPAETNLIRLGQAGQPAAVPIIFQPSIDFTGTQMAVQMINAINNSPRLIGVEATPGGAELVVIEGAAAIDDVDFVLNSSLNGLSQIGAIRDFAGNELKPNQFSGETKVSIVLGDVDLDFGDAPDPEFPTLFRSNGAIHVLSGQTFLGSGMDVETEALQNINADGDALDDGVVFLGIVNPFVDTPIEVTVSVDGLIDAWIDYNRDGDWDDVGEQIFASQEVFAEPNGTAGPNSLVFRAPGGIELGTTTYTRFRFSTTGGLLPTGLASDGEVEDYEVPLAIGSPPTANDDNSYTISEDAMLTVTTGFGLLTNDTDAETPASVSVVEFDATSDLGAIVIVNSDGSFTYDPTDASALQLLRNGQTAHDTFTYTISDGQFGRDTATVAIIVNGNNDDPTPQDDTIGTDEVTGVTFNVLPNDTDPDNTTAELTVVDFNATFATGVVTFNTSNNRFTYLPNGQFEFVPVNGTATDTFTYTVEDPDGATATATVTIVISGLNSNPTGIDDTATTDQDTPIDIDVAANDVDPDGDALVIHTINDFVTIGAVGPFTAGTITYDPDGQFNSLADGESGSDTFSYIVRDNNGGFTSASVTVTINGTNDDPVAVDDDISSGAATDNATPVSIDVIANDIDVDNGDQLTLIAVNGTGTAGTVVVDSGQVTYDPNGQFNGLTVGQTATDTFTYVVQDSSGAVSTGTVTVTVAGFNEDPVANADSDSTDEDTSISIDVIANDTDGEGHALTVVDVSSIGTVGRVILTGDGSSVTFDPRGRFDGLQVGETFNDSFTYTVRDEFGGTSTGTVSVSVDGVNDNPIGRADSYDVLIGRTFNGSTVLVNDSDDDSTGLMAQIVTPTQNGIINLNSDGTFTYNTTTSDVGTDAFTYRVLDGDGGQSDPVVVTLNLARSKWQNPLLHNDVNADGGVSPLDALIVINYINANGNAVPADPAEPPPYYDVDGDGSVTPNDVIIIVNYLNRQANPGLGEAIVEIQPEAAKTSTEETTVVEQVEERSFAPLRRDIQVARAMEQMRNESDDAQLDDLVDDIVEAGLEANAFDAAIDNLFG
jgi:VCBS repeat-containing protein